MSASRSSFTSLNNFFIFNSSYGSSEGEEEQKILFYYPKDADIDSKIKTVGLCEAIIKFTHTFTDKPCESLHTLKTRQLFYEPEKDFWMIMTINVPRSEKTKDGQTCFEYHEDDIHDHIYEALLKQAYRMFQFFNGTIEYILAKSQIEGLKLRLEHFFQRYLLTLNVTQSDILTIFNGIHFLPLDKNTYLQIQCFVNLLESTFPVVKYTAFLYNGQLVWSGLGLDDMRVMYRYLTTSLMPNYQEHELQAGHSLSSKPVLSAIAPLGHYGKFICGPPNVHDLSDLGKIPRVFVNTTETNEECYLFVYKALSATICLLVNSKSQLQPNLFSKIDGFLGPRLTALASDIGEQYSKKLPQSVSEPQCRYVYFNHMNLAQKTTLHVDRKSSVHVPSQTVQILNDINATLIKEDLGGEMIVKTTNDYWVVGKKCDKREFYVVLNQKNANLIEINEEVKKLCSTHFSSIFFQD